MHGIPYNIRVLSRHGIAVREAIHTDSLIAGGSAKDTRAE